MSRASVIRAMFRLMACLIGYSKSGIGNAVFYGEEQFLRDAAAARDLMACYSSSPENPFWEILSEPFIIFDARSKPMLNFRAKLIGISHEYLAWGAHGIIAYLLYAGFIRRLHHSLTLSEKRERALTAAVSSMRRADFPEQFLEALERASAQAAGSGKCDRSFREEGGE